MRGSLLRRAGGRGRRDSKRKEGWFGLRGVQSPWGGGGAGAEQAVRPAGRGAAGSGCCCAAFFARHLWKGS